MMLYKHSVVISGTKYLRYDVNKANNGTVKVVSLGEWLGQSN